MEDTQIEYFKNVANHLKLNPFVGLKNYNHKLKGSQGNWNCNSP